MGFLGLLLALSLDSEFVGNPPSQVLHLVFEVLVLLFNILNFNEHLRLTLFGLEGFTHSIGDGTLVQSLECLYRHFYFVSHTHQQKAPLGAVNCNLPNYLVEALRIQLLSDGADSCFPCLSLLQLFVELILQIDDVQAGCWTW